jgi:hypothetical protein
MGHPLRTVSIGILVALAMLVAASTRTVRADDPVSSSVRYNREIVRIFERKCISCHTDTSLAMPLDSYHDVRPWARAIREEILERRMPPWPAAPGVRPLANELALTTREIAIVMAWIDGGTPRGEPEDLPAPKPSGTWKAGEPDLMLRLPSQQVTADGTAYVRRVTVATGLAGDRWLRGFDVVPGERRFVRSVFLYLRSAAGVEQWLGGWTPWHAMTQAPANVAFRLPAGMSLDVELHYAGWDDTPRPGSEQGDPTLTDTSTVGLYFQRERPASAVDTVSMTATGAASRLRSEATLNADTVVWAVKPGLSRGELVQPGAIEMRAILPGGGTEPILWIRDHGSEWQLPYVLREPLRLPRGSRLVLTAHGADIAGATATASVLTYPPVAGADPTTGHSLKGRTAQPLPR